MANDSQKWSHIESILAMLFVLFLILAFAGEPDMWDVLIEKLKK